MLDLSKPVSWVTGAKKEEQTKVVLAFLALLCLLISYYLVKPLRNSKFLEEFHPSRLPLVYAATAFLSFAITKVFSHLAKTVEKYRLVAGAYVIIICFKLILGSWLESGGKTAVVCFYFFASVYFLLAVATLWACVNDMFTTSQGERCFGFVALGGTLGSILGSHISNLITRSDYRDQALYCSIVFMLAALGLVLLAAKLNRDESPRLPRIPAREIKRGDFWTELRALAERPYLRRLALTVMFLAVATTAIEFVSQTTIDRELARQQYQLRFAELETATFDGVYRLKSRSPEARLEYLEGLAERNEMESEEVGLLYETYRTELEVETRSFFSVTYYYQGILGVFSLLVVARFLFPRVGMRYCYTLLPLLSLTGFALFGLTVDLLLVQIVLILVGAFNYSLNNAAKEILYTATDEETLFRFKPMIEGPCMRAGDVLSSVLKLSAGALAVSLALEEVAATHLFLVVTGTLLLAWLRAAWLAGKEYDLQKGRDTEES